MTREEYVDFANALKNNYTIDFDKIPEFCDMAISLLSENKGDLISRQAINGYIDYILSHGMGKKKSFDFIKKFVANLPSGIPQQNKGDFEGMANGEVIQALFPQIELVEIYNGRHRFFLKGKESSAFDLKAEVKWLNTPYQKGGKE